MKFKSLMVMFLLTGYGLVGCSGVDGPVEGEDVGVNQDVQGDGDVEGDGDGEGDGETPVALELTSISPTTGSTEGGTVVTLSGQGFQEGMQVFFGSFRATSVVRYGQLSAEAVSPAREVGAVDVSVINPDDEESVLVGAFVYEEEETGPREGLLGYCQVLPETSQQNPLVVSQGVPFSLGAVVFVEGLTEGEGQGEGVEVELGFGRDFESLQWAPMQYLGDRDGLSAGDLANDEYAREVEAEETGEYIYFARAKGPGDDDWIQCGMNGPVLGLPSGSAFGYVRAEEPTDDDVRPTDCGIQFPALAQNLLAGEDITLYGRVFEPGLTDQADLPATFLAEALIGPAGANPETQPGDFTTLVGTRNLEYLAADFEEFEVTTTLTEAGIYGYVFRFSLDDGGHWTYCDLEGMRREEEVEPDNFGALVVTDTAATPLTYCRTFEEVFAGQVGEEGPEIWMELYQGGITDESGVNNSAQFEVEAGYGPVGANPALEGFVWTSLSYAGVGPNDPNNYEFSGALYSQGADPGLGSFGVITRAREVGSAIWTYCNNNSDEPEFSLEVISVLHVEP